MRSQGQLGLLQPPVGVPFLPNSSLGWLLPRGWSGTPLCQSLPFISVSLSSKWAAILISASPAVKGLENFSLLGPWLLRPNHGLIATRNLFTFHLLGPCPPPEWVARDAAPEALGVSQGKCRGAGQLLESEGRERRKSQTVVVKGPGNPEPAQVRPRSRGPTPHPGLRQDGTWKTFSKHN